MKRLASIFLFVSAFFGLAFAAQAPQCGLVGQCSGYLEISTSASNETECQDKCEGNVDCQYYTFCSSGQFCGLFANCTSLSGTNCVSGERGCSNVVESPNADCEMNGSCTGNTVNYDLTASVTECYNDCVSTANCTWYTWDPSSNMCTMFADCTFSNTSCPNCITGQMNCTATEPDLVCDVPGSCSGNPVDFELETSADDCREACQATPSCEWYMWDSSGDLCTLLADCAYDNSTCPTCVVGQRNCTGSNPPPPTGSGDFTVLMAIGGYPTGANFKVEFVDLSGQKLKCENASDYFEDYGSTGAYVDDKAFVCGGYKADVGSNYCYSYNNVTKQWDSEKHLSVRRAFASAVAFHNGLWMVTGGRQDSNTNDYQSTEIASTSNDMTFLQYELLPAPKSFHNLVRLNSTHVFLLGGSELDDRVWIHDRVMGGWDELTSSPMPGARRYTHAGLATRDNGDQELVVAGGEFNDTSDILDLKTMMWRDGPKLPFDLQNGASVEFGSTFLLVGGYSILGGNVMESIIEYNPGPSIGNESWTVRNETLKMARQDFAAFMVPNNYVACS